MWEALASQPLTEGERFLADRIITILQANNNWDYTWPEIITDKFRRDMLIAMGKYEAAYQGPRENLEHYQSAIGIRI